MGEDYIETKCKYVVADDIQKFMELTCYMMGIVDEFMHASDASTYGGFRKDLDMFDKMVDDLRKIVNHRSDSIRHYDNSSEMLRWKL